MGSVYNDILNVFRKNSNQVTKLIVINVLVFVGIALASFMSGFFVENNTQPFAQNLWMGSTLRGIVSHPWTLLWHPFTHGGLLPLLSDIIILYWFGNMLADLLGGKKMVITYLYGAFFGAVFFLLVWGFFERLNPTLNYQGFLYGSSAGGFAIMYAYVALNPDSELMIFTMRVKTRLLVLILLLVSVLLNPPMGVMDLGGAAFGYLQMKLLRAGVNLTSGAEGLFMWIEGIGKPKQKSFSKKYPKPVTTPRGKVVPFPVRDTEPSQDEVDHLLDKISKVGYESLTAEEKQRLHKASQNAD